MIWRRSNGRSPGATWPHSWSSRSRARASISRTTSTCLRRPGCAARHGTLLVADEIQTGMGRTGRFLASEHWGVEPDLVLLAKALSGGFVPVGAVACRREVFDRVFDRMDRALVHGSTFAKNDLAMAAGLATLTALEDERLIARAAELGARLVDGLRRNLAPFDMVKEVRGKGMMIALQLGPPRDLRLKAAYALMDRASKGLFCQLILIQLLRNHRILAQVAGHDLPVIKLLPPLVLSEQDVEWMLRAFAAVIGDSQSLASLASLGRELAGHALRTRADAA